MSTRWGDEMSWQQETFWHNWDWQHEQLQRQEDMAAQQENWLREDTIQAQQYNSTEAEKAFNRQIQFQNMQNEWNSVVSQADRFRAAGINPYVALAGSGGQMSPAVSAPPAASSGIPSGRSPGLSSLSPIPVGSVNSHGSKFLDIVGAIKDVFGSMASAAKAGVDTYHTVKGFNIIGSEIDKASSEADIERINADLLRIYGGQRMSAEVQKMLSEVSLLGEQVLTEASKRADYDASASLKKMEEKLADVQAQYYGEERDLAAQRNKTFMTKFNADLANVQSQTRLNNASGNNQNAQAEYYWNQAEEVHKRINDILPWQKKQEIAEATIKSCEAALAQERSKYREFQSYYEIVSFYNDVIGKITDNYLKEFDAHTKEDCKKWIYNSIMYSAELTKQQAGKTEAEKVKTQRDDSTAWRFIDTLRSIFSFSGSSSNSKTVFENVTPTPPKDYPGDRYFFLH